jgi:hypothetical protein
MRYGKISYLYFTVIRASIKGKYEQEKRRGGNTKNKKGEKTGKMRKKEKIKAKMKDSTGKLSASK